MILVAARHKIRYIINQNESEETSNNEISLNPFLKREDKQLVHLLFDFLVVQSRPYLATYN